MMQSEAELLPNEVNPPKTFNKLEEFIEFLEKEDRFTLGKSVIGNEDKIIALFNDIEQFEKVFEKDTKGILPIIKRFLIKKATLLIKSLDQLFVLLKKSEWQLAFVNNQEAIVQMSLLFQSWDDIFTHSADLFLLPDLFKSNPKHFASLVSDPNQITNLYIKNPLLASNFLRSLNHELDGLYSTSEQLQTVAIIDEGLAEAIAQKNNIPIKTSNNLGEILVTDNLAPVTDNRGPQVEPIKKPSKPNISLAVLGGFITACGIAAVALALTVLSFGLFDLIIAGVGAVTALVGIGMFSAGLSIKKESPSAHSNLNAPQI